MDTHILDNFNGKLYHKETIKNWQLPQFLEEQLGIDKYEYFFLTTSIEQEKHGNDHIHLSIFPTKFNIVYLLEVETSTILPKLLHDTLNLIKQAGKDIITSTGFCSSENLCYFGIFFSSKNIEQFDNLLDQIKKLENVHDALVFQYTCEGCKQI
ncbi:MAG: hypothetical protein EU543_04910 [Promethearchaeota archaeon]|nr:MAG: hypothetical protein EU543_04910 [Candidatus Lokiarchaeota archaeon]